MDILSSREWAIVTWIIIYLCITIFVLKVDFTDVFKSFFNKKLSILWISILLYNLFITIILSYSRYWNNIYIKDIVFWIVFSCITSTISVFDQKKIFFFKKIILTNITVSALIEFIISELTLSYCLELFFIGIFLPINLLFLVSQTSLEYKTAEDVLKKILSLINIIFVVYILVELYKSFNFLLSQETWFKFIIPLLYSILCSPLYYIFIILNDLNFLEDILGWLAVILMAIILRFTDWYILDPLLSLVISFFILSKAIPRFWSTLKIFLDAVPEGVDIKQVKSRLEQLDYVASVNQLNLWTMDGLEKNAIIHVCLEHVKHMEVCKESIRDLLKERGFQNVTIEVDSSLMNHAHHKRCVDELKSLDEHEH